VAEICTAFDIKPNHLTKVVHHLGRCGWVDTLRGKGGGLMLARPPSEIRIGQVVLDTEGQAEPAECFADEPSRCTIVRCCRLKGVLAQAVEAFYAVLDRSTLADITASPQELGRVLQFTRPPKATTH
jgi:Rrf2 family nitric oxide-sensitive transcriptional repressor